MPGTDLQQERRRVIEKLLEMHEIERQSQLVELLRAEGYTATQSSVSRDLASLGVVRQADRYSLPANRDGAEAAELPTIAEFVRGIRAAGPNLLVISTAIGAAQRVGLVLDRLMLPEVIGTLSGDDTIFVATANKAQQRTLLARLEDTFRNAR